MYKFPLAKRMCPKTLNEFVGQEHVLGENKILRRAIESDKLTSMILYGPSGTGKNAIANVIANITKSNFKNINAATAGVSDIKKIINSAEADLNMFNKKTILFVDEIHRFNKLQQDALLPDVENGKVILIGATTHNPYFFVNSALISRSLVIEFFPLSYENLKRILIKALSEDKGLKKYKVHIETDALNHIVKHSNGDARIALNSIEIGVLTTKPNERGIIHFTLNVAEESIQKKFIRYDKGEDEHYDTISAFIKSMRGSDPDAALYWLAKMIVAGEDPRFIARRIVICASEDVGNADPNAIVVANAVLQIVEFIGMPEAKIPLAQAVTYVACAPKSNAAYKGISKAIDDVQNKDTLQVPNHLKDNSRDGKNLGHGIGYKYPHDYNNHYVKQNYLPEKRTYYEPVPIGFEKKIIKFLKDIKS